jgi:hypothetical protein
MIQKREHISKPLFFIDYAKTVDHIYTLFLKRDKKSCTCYSSYDLIDFIVFQSQKVVFKFVCGFLGWGGRGGVYNYISQFFLDSCVMQVF